MSRLINLINLVSLTLGIFVFLVNTAAGIYSIGSKLYPTRYSSLIASAALFLAWIIVSIAVYFLTGLAAFSTSETILDRLASTLIILVYLTVGCMVFWLFRLINARH